MTAPPAFTFETTPRIVSRPGAIADLGVMLRDLGCQRVLLVTDRDLVRLRLIEAGMASLGQAGIGVTVFADVVPDPPEPVVEAAAEAARRAGVDGVCGLGGGSVLDTAKLVAVLARGGQPLAQMYGVGQVRGGRLPLVLAPTTAGTGSEVTPVAIVSTGDAQKKGVVARQLLPDAAILDANLTLGLPPLVTAATGIDAMVHAIEAYTSALRKNPVSDALAREALVLLGGAIRRVCTTPRDAGARGAMLLGSMLAGMAFANAPVAAVHALAYPLGGHFKLAHGACNALMLPHVLAYNAPAAAPLYAELAPLVFPDLAPRDQEGRVEGFIAGFARLGQDLGLAMRLRDVGVRAENLPMLASDALEQTRLLVNNPRAVTFDAALALYRAAM